MSKKEIKYRSAFLEDGTLINIEDVDTGNRKKYICINKSCGEILTARKGEEKAHHFAHRAGSKCHYNKYLHDLAIIKFKTEYEACVENGTPFYLEYQMEQICTTCNELENLPDSCRLEPKTELFDLTQRFPLLTKEKSRDGFIADLLLESEDRKDFIFIEFAVTHKCEHEKLEAGFRVVEFLISKEDDLQFITNHRIAQKELFCSYYNFQVKERRYKIFSFSKCPKRFDSYIVFSSGKAIVKQLSPREVLRESGSKATLELRNLALEGQPYEKRFAELIEESSSKGVPVKNCFACRFYTRNNRFHRIEDYWCKKHKAEVENSNSGATCSSFWRLPKRDPEIDICYAESSPVIEERKENFLNQIFSPRPSISEPIEREETDDDFLKKGYEIFSYPCKDPDPQIMCPMNNRLIHYTICKSCAFSGKELETKVLCGFKNRVLLT